MSQKPPFMRWFLRWKFMRKIEEPVERAAGELNLDDGLLNGLRAWKARGKSVDDERTERADVAAERTVVPEGTP